MKTAIVTRALILTALMLGLSAIGAHAQPGRVRMTFSGTNVATTINLQPNTVTDEVHLAGVGSLGPFTFRELHADGGLAAPPAGCVGPYFGVVAGAGALQFADGSLLILNVVDGSGCVNLSTVTAALTVNYVISGGTGRFAGASGNLTMLSTLKVVLGNAANAPALLTNVGRFEGTIVRPDDEQ